MTLPRTSSRSVLPRLRRKLVASALGISLVASIFASTATAAPKAPSGAPTPPAPAVQFGFNEWPNPVHYSLQKQLNAPIRRMAVGWNQVQPTSGAWDWKRTDEQYNSLRAAGLKPLIYVTAAPCWATSQACRDDVYMVPDAAHDAAWTEFVRRVARRYRDAVAIEVWNEPNVLPSFWPGADAVRYTALLKLAYRAVKGENSRMPVITGGLFSSSLSGYYGLADGAFLTAMYAAGAKGFMDGIGLHPFPNTEGTDGTAPHYDVAAFDETLSRVRLARTAGGDSATPIWVTEVGESTTSQEGAPAAASDTQQAADLLTMVASIKAATDIPVAIIHRLIDSPSAGGPYAALEGGFGLFREDGSPKPAACELSRALGGSLGCTG